MSKPKTIQISAKCSDGFGAYVFDEAREIVGDYQGYVPDFLSGDMGEDYIDLEIDLDTGKILNWKRPTKAKLKELGVA